MKIIKILQQTKLFNAFTEKKKSDSGLAQIHIAWDQSMCRFLVNVSIVFFALKIIMNIYNKVI